MAEMVRINTRISKTLNDWLDAKSEETGVPKSTLVFMSLDATMNQEKAMEVVKDASVLQSLIQEIQTLKESVQGNVQK